MIGVVGSLLFKITVILVVVDRLSKASQFGMLPTNFTAVKVADLYLTVTRFFSVVLSVNCFVLAAQSYTCPLRIIYKVMVDRNRQQNASAVPTMFCAR
jgi:hypothetical protein